MTKPCSAAQSNAASCSADSVVTPEDPAIASTSIPNATAPFELCVGGFPVLDAEHRHRGVHHSSARVAVADPDVERPAFLEAVEFSLEHCATPRLRCLFDRESNGKCRLALLTSQKSYCSQVVPSRDAGGRRHSRIEAPRLRRARPELNERVSPPPGDSPEGPVPPRQPQSGVRRRISWPLIVMGLVTIVALVVAAYVLIVVRKDSGDGEVVLQAVASDGPFPWTPTVTPADVPTSVPSGPPGTSALPPIAPTVAGTPGGLTPVAGGEPGLYGGSNELTVCDKGKLISFLESNPDKRAAFAGVFGISDVRRYVESLTPVILTADTRVTNHGFENGRATPFQSVLQAGTAVLVDDRGVPKVRCACGNPLLPPTPTTSNPKYTGDSWPGFDAGRNIVVQPTSTPITQITVINMSNGAPLVITVMRTAASAEGPESIAGWSGEYQVTSYEKIRNDSGTCRDPTAATISVSVIGGSITIWGEYTGTMTTPDTFGISEGSVYVNTFDGRFARVDDVATLDMTYTQTSPEGTACSYRYVGTLRG